MIKDAGIRDAILSFLDDQKKKVRRGDAKSPDDIDNYLINCEMALELGDVYEVALYFAYLGKTVAAEELPSLDEFQRLKDRTARQTGALEAVNEERTAKRDPLKSAALERSREIWGGDVEECQRLGDVTGKAFKTVTAEAKRLGIDPVCEATVRRWIREIAPEYARKPGVNKKIRQK